MKKFREIDLSIEKLVYLTPPHAPAIVSTISPFKNYNLGTFEQFMACSNTPSRIILVVTPNSDTFKNIRDGSDFCVGIPTLDIIEQIYRCGEKYERHLSEFDLCGLTPKMSLKIRAPQILECSVNLECTLFKVIEVGDHSIIIGDVVRAEIDENIYSKDKVERRLNLNAPYYASSGYFSKLEKIIKAKK